MFDSIEFLDAAQSFLSDLSILRSLGYLEVLPPGMGHASQHSDARLLAQLNSSPAQCLERLNDLANEHFELQLITYSAARDGDGQRVIEFSEEAEAKLFEIAEEIRRLEDTYGMTY